ncbi:MAG: hypothetical protein CMJ34_06055 [Phycisphaerae bacterium]|nr:hypothetical protein [Phycisphaerae bacterium]
MIRQLVPTPIWILPACLLAVGCSTPTSSVERMSNALVRGEMAEDDARVMVDVRGVLDVVIESFAGNVRIEEVPGMEGATIEPVRRAYLGHSRRDEGEQALEDIEYRIELRKGELDRETVFITTSTAHPEDHLQGVDFFIRTGQLGGIDISTTRGHVWVKNNSGPVDIETTYGDVRVVTDHPMNDSIVLVTKDASIDYRVGPGSTGLYDLRSVGGRVYQRFTEAPITATSEENGPSIFVGEVGDGENPVILRTTYGDIRVAVVDEPTEVGPVIVE